MRVCNLSTTIAINTATILLVWKRKKFARMEKLKSINREIDVRWQKPHKYMFNVTHTSQHETPTNANDSPANIHRSDLVKMAPAATAPVDMSI